MKNEDSWFRNKLIKISLLLIIILAAILRIYQIDKAPPSLSWDEAANGYNAFTIANWGRDEYGNFFPLYFRSFADDKHPVHIYSTALFVKFLGLNEFSTRLPSAVFGTLNILLIFFLAYLLFKNQIIALVAAGFLAISPQSIHFSRFNHEANFALFFFLAGLILFYLFIKRKAVFLPYSILSFSISFLAYHPAKFVVSVTILFLSILYAKQLFLNKKASVTALVIILLTGFIVLVNPQLLGFARLNQNTLSKEKIRQTKLFELTQNEFLGKIDLYLIQYSWHFSPTYLFELGDKNARLSSQTGEFYKIDALFLIIGFTFLLYKRTKEAFLLLLWAAISPIPSAVVAEAPHAGRSMFMMGSLHIIAAVGFYRFITLFRRKVFKLLVAVLVVVILFLSLKNYLSYYFNEYARRYAIEWQYGMKQVVEYVGEHHEYDYIFMTDIRSQPYIFFLYYLKSPLPEYLSNVVYNRDELSKSYNTVSYFTNPVNDNKQKNINFFFGGWDPIESTPDKGRLYILSPSQYDGLRYRSAFDVKKIVYYLNGTTAFYLVGSL